MAYTTIDDPTIYFNTKLYTGNGSNRTITGVGFQPDWVWIKDRGNATNHMLFDSVRGTGKELHSQNGDTETTQSNTLTAFGSDGFSLGSHADVNDSSDTYVSWNWLAGTSFSNSAGANGADLASVGSYNRDAGFSIVTFTGNATADQQIYHGLNSVPKWMILKNRTNSNGESWAVYHASLGNTYRLNLNTNSARSNSDSAEFWADTTPTSTVLSIGRQDQVNGSGNTHVVYCFSEIKGYSKFGSYNGNGNADGPFIYTGFKPAFLIVKAYSNAQDWEIFDNKRSTFNPLEKNLAANSSSSEQTDLDIDFLSNGFKVRIVDDSVNNSSYSYIYMAFAESPFVNSNGVPCNAR